MGKKINYAILALIAVVLVWGVIAACLTRGTSNYKRVSNIDKTGKSIVSYEVDEEDSHLYVEGEPEVVSMSEYYRRVAKQSKISMNVAKENYEEDGTDAKLKIYNNAKRDYELALNQASRFSNSLFVTSAGTFFGTYFTIIVLLGIAFIINTKINCCKE